MPVSKDLLGRFGAFGTHRGQLRLKMNFSAGRFGWRALIRSSAISKRIVDIIGSSCALAVVGAPLMFISGLVRLDGGPAIFAQTRVGRHGREFKMFKFRSMRVDAEKHLAALLAANQHGTGVTFKIKNDPRVTKIGYWLRRYSLDELPQFYNVLRGDMSLVGPRPPVPREVALYSLADRRRLEVKPGITCVWQISGRAEIDFPGQVQLDVNYIESQSLGKDIKIMAKTPRAVVFGPGAY
jgi:lipopolysaccharide/colanic/teichoic acid biosynthesis glycosyltransferase